MKNYFYVFVSSDGDYNINKLKANEVLITCRTYAGVIDTLNWAKDHKWNVLIDLSETEKEYSYNICKFITEKNIPLLGYKSQDIDVKHLLGNYF